MSPIDPVPEGTQLDYGRVAQVLGDWLAEDPGRHSDLEYNRLRWTVEPFDDFGVADVTVWHSVTGELVGAARVHWSALVADPPTASHPGGIL